MELDLENLSVGHLIETEKGQNFFFFFLLNLILFYGVKSRKSRKAVYLMFCFFSIISYDNLGLQTSSDRRPHVVDRNHHISLHTNAQREIHLSFLEPVLSGGSQERQGCIKEVTVVIAEMNIFCQK